MSNLIASSNRRAIIGAGVTGRSIARFLLAKGVSFDWFDTRDQLPGSETTQPPFDGCQITTGPLADDALSGYTEIYLSPGIPLDRPFIRRAQEAGADVIGDIELFARYNQTRIAAVTGSNGKTTVATLLTEAVAATGLHVAAAGNIGQPALGCLEAAVDLLVLELSSFQLEATRSLRPEVACILNLSPDHLDHHPDMLAYHRAKQRIYQGASVLVFNRDDDLTQPLLASGQREISFGSDEPDLGQFGLMRRDGLVWLCRGRERLVDSARLQLSGHHNHLNVLAVLAMCEALNLDLTQVVERICSFQGLPHRTQEIARVKGVRWINDSKATNVGAAIAAIDSFRREGQLILIAGGQTKGQNFAPFAQELARGVSLVVLMGEGADQIALAITRVLGDKLPIARAASMQDAVAIAHRAAKAGDIVLLSPACASFDQYQGYADRGEKFGHALQQVAA